MKNDDSRGDGEESSASGSAWPLREPPSRGTHGAQRASSASIGIAATELHEFSQSLRLAFSAAVVCAGALRHQNADMDAEIALVLKSGCCDRLDGVIERLEALARNLRRNHSA